MKKYLIVLLILFTRISFSQSLGSESGLKVKGLNLGQSALSVKKVTATGTAVSYDADAQAYFDTVTIRGGTITTARKDTINLFVEMLKDSLALTNLRDGFDRMWLLAAQDTVSALTSLVNPSSTKAIGIASPTFAYNRGFTGNASSSYINSNYNPNTDKIVYALNTGTIGFYSNTNNNSTFYRDISARDNASNYEIAVLAAYTTVFIARLNVSDTYTPSVANTNTIGLFVASRTSSTAIFGYKDGAQVINTTDATNGIPSYSLYIGAYNNTGTASTFSPRQYSVAFMGKGLTSAENLKLWHCVQWYLNTLGFGI